MKINRYIEIGIQMKRFDAKKWVAKASHGARSASDTQIHDDPVKTSMAIGRPAIIEKSVLQ
ncbi:MAG: hypothetical protein EOO28_32330 [Comamonadaceae bacterium]|nr:MAG: hypothetical protein EOO28_32330 [Comamonadaceae bacterium]